MDTNFRLIGEREEPQSSLSGQGRLSATYRELELAFGPPRAEFSDRVSTRWRFRGGGHEFEIMDYKATSLYDDTYPSVEEFRTREVPYDWHVMAVDSAPVEDFVWWVTGEITRASTPMSLWDRLNEEL